ncbi:uncharacterized protein LOC119666586 [Teleopsis dalmanni]|nr:uncharacterized protein LOC119666586 [Teleopsis dalmanni]
MNNDTIHVKGKAKMTAELPKNTPIKVYGQIYKKSRGQWVNTIYNFARPDLCTALFTPGEYWSKMVQQLSIKRRQCPFPKNYSLNFDLFTDLIANDIVDKNGSGEYKLNANFGYGTKEDEFICVNIIFYATRFDNTRLKV